MDPRVSDFKNVARTDDSVRQMRADTELSLRKAKRTEQVRLTVQIYWSVIL